MPVRDPEIEGDLKSILAIEVKDNKTARQNAKIEKTNPQTKPNGSIFCQGGAHLQLRREVLRRRRRLGEKKNSNRPRDSDDERNIMDYSDLATPGSPGSSAATVGTLRHR